jgi:hypothetical protein
MSVTFGLAASRSRPPASSGLVCGQEIRGAALTSRLAHVPETPVTSGGNEAFTEWFAPLLEHFRAAGAPAPQRETRTACLAATVRRDEPMVGEPRRVPMTRVNTSNPLRARAVPDKKPRPTATLALTRGADRFRRGSTTREAQRVAAYRPGPEGNVKCDHQVVRQGEGRARSLHPERRLPRPLVRVGHHAKDGPERRAGSEERLGGGGKTKLLDVSDVRLLRTWVRFPPAPLSACEGR